MNRLPIISLMVLLLCACQDVHTSSKTTEPNLFQQRTQRLTGKYSVGRSMHRARRHKKELAEIHAYADGLQAKIDAFGSYYPRRPTRKPVLSALHEQVLSPIPDIIRRFYCGGIVNGIHRPGLHSADVNDLFKLKSPDLSVFHQGLVSESNRYHQRLRNRYLVYQRSSQENAEHLEENAILRAEYSETIVPFVDCIGVAARVQKEHPRTFFAAVKMWQALARA